MRKGFVMNYKIRMTVVLSTIFIFFMPSQLLGAAVLADTTSPKVISISISDPTPGSSHGMIYPDIFTVGELMVEIEFSEDMRTLTMPSAEIMVGNGRKLPVTSGEWVTNRYWVGSISEDAIINEYSDNGKIYATVKNGSDLAGNPLREAKSAIYYLDIKPRFSTPRVFPNPVSNFDYMVSVTSSEELQSPPQVFINSEVVEMKALSGINFIGSVYISQQKIGVNSMRVSGIDLQGNAGNWPQTADDYRSAPFAKFMVAELGPSGGEITTPDGEGRVKISSDVLSQNHNFVMMFEKSDSSVICKNRIINVYPSVSLSKTAIVFFRPDTDENSLKASLYSLDSGNPVFLDRAFLDSDGILKAETRRLGKLAFMTDISEPQITVSRGHHDGKIHVEVKDDLSGIDFSNALFEIDGIPADFEADPDNQRFVCSIREIPGKNVQFTASVSDRQGNVKNSSIRFTMQAPAKLNNFRVYPQPAVETAYFECAFDTVPSEICLELFESSGKKILKNNYPASADSVMELKLDKNGRRLASGAYLYRMRALFSGGEVIEKQGRISIMGGM